MQESGVLYLKVGFYDLNEEAQKKVLKFYDCTKPDEINAEIFTVAVLEKEF